MLCCPFRLRCAVEFFCFLLVFLTTTLSRALSPKSIPFPVKSGPTIHRIQRHELLRTKISYLGSFLCISLTSLNFFLNSAPMSLRSILYCSFSTEEGRVGREVEGEGGTEEGRRGFYWLSGLGEDGEEGVRDGWM